MPLEAPGTVTPISEVPDPNVRFNFNTLSFNWMTTARAAMADFAVEITKVYNNASYVLTLATQVETAATEASDSASAAAASAAASAASASTALNSPATSATSTTSLTIGNGTHTFTIQLNKSFAVGQTVVLASAANALNQMVGIITAHDPVAGSMTVVVTANAFSGSGTYADWVIALTASTYATSQIVNLAANSAAITTADYAQLLVLALTKKG